ncbi:hypothetical protein LZA78_12935 [Sinirhodobacter sp. WL0062]|uniref:Excalibur calcium-binding domain-containing protein n=1 Tax=Rhodobacter flavimaris TaxID=2907145 RepID=A0ABS8Z0G3_9RHOB|nr:hypothetical protein [Sinirhodobacter sp. WL0062]MCE5974387.1 hypothetical protein [Sinirhodobacter sp. WL0062]
MKILVLALPALALMACTPTGSGTAGVGFGDYGTYLAQREAELVGQRQAAIPAPKIAPAQPVVAAAAPVPANNGYGTAPLSALAPAAIQPGAAVPTAVVATPAAGDQSLGQEALATLAATSPTPTAAPLVPAAPAPVVAPAVQGSAGPNLAAYALSATNGMGQQIYDRGGFHLTDSGKACAKYISPDLAQMAFLEKGGPQKDSLNLDPDGDGFACGWDPRPFQAARQ